MDLSKFVGMGFSFDWLNQMVSAHGQEVLLTVEDLFTKGFSVSWVVELANTVGHLFTPAAQMMSCAAHRVKMMGAVVPGTQVDSLPGGGFLDVIQGFLTNMLAGKVSPEEANLINAVVALIKAKLFAAAHPV